ncbi:MAG: hypothetical protein ACLFRD_08810 [Nitriliruptoraceae bacterium]
MLSYRIVSVVALVGALVLLGVPVLAAPGETDPEINAQLAQVRRATSQYQDIEAAEAAGYQLDDQCVPGMGYHALRVPFDEVDDEVDYLDPEALVYAPGDDGLELVAVEYLSSEADTSLFGRSFDPAHGPVPPSLHAWVWRGNPDGVFSPTNPNITCPEQ